MFYESHIAAIIKVDESNYIGACSQDAGTGDSMFTTNLASHGNLANEKIINSNEEANEIIEEIVQQLIRQKIIETER